MNYKRIIFMIMITIVIIISCNKEEEGITASKGNSAADKTGDNTEMQLVAIKSQATVSTGYEYVQLIGHSEANNPDCRYFAISIYSRSVTTGTYQVPEYTPGYSYDNTAGFVTGYFSLTPSIEVTDWYSSQYIPGAGGSVSISSLSGDRIIGSYNLVLVSYKDRTKKLNLKGNFSANFASITD
jgi:hypothetical protein